MSFATSRVFSGCRALLAPAKSAASTTTAAAAASKGAATTTKAAGAKPKQPKPKSKSATTSGIMKPVPVSPVLRDFIGAPEASRSAVVKQIWAHIKQHNLQNPTNKKEIFCDAKLKAIFDGKDKVGFLEIGKLLSHHFVKTG